MFVKWDCGCLGLKLDDQAIVIKACDDTGIGFSSRTMVDKTWTKLSDKDSSKLMAEVQKLIFLGDKLLDFNSTLKSLG